MKKSGFKYLHDVEELNITAFMNLMVILVPFLLITAVFSRMTVLELNLPGPDSKEAPPPDPKEIRLQLILRSDAFYLVQAGDPPILLTALKRDNGDVDWQKFTFAMRKIKETYPEKEDFTVLVEPGIKYKTLIKVMDHVRSVDVVENLSVVTYPLFPNISLGDALPLEKAPAADAATAQGAAK